LLNSSDASSYIPLQPKIFTAMSSISHTNIICDDGKVRIFIERKWFWEFPHRLCCQSYMS